MAKYGGMYRLPNSFWDNYGKETEQNDNEWALPSAITAGGGLLGMIGSLFGQPKMRMQSMQMAGQRFKDLTDLSSSYYSTVRKYYGEVASKAAPTLNTMYGWNKSQGISSGGSNALAVRQTMAESGRIREESTQAMIKQFLSSEDAASRYLGQMMQSEATLLAGKQEQSDTVTSLFENLFQLGSGGLLNSLFGKG